MFLSKHLSSMLRMVAVLHHFVMYEKSCHLLEINLPINYCNLFSSNSILAVHVFFWKHVISSHQQALSGYPPSLFISQIRSSEQFFVVSTKGNALETDAAFPGIDAMTEIVHNPFFLDHPDAVVDGKDGKQLDVNTVHSPAAGTIFGLWARHGETCCYCCCYWDLLGWEYRLIGMKITVQNPFLFFPERALHEKSIASIEEKPLDIYFFLFFSYHFSFLRYLYTLHETNIAPGNGWLDT